MSAFDEPTRLSAEERLAQQRAVLSKAVTRAAAHLELSQQLLARTLGLSPATVSRLHQGKYLLEPSRKEWELAMMLVRLFRALDTLVGSPEAARRWMNSPNHALYARPIDLIPHAEGLVNVVQYLDASRHSR